jgi:hypothetical protein
LSWFAVLVSSEVGTTSNKEIILFNLKEITSKDKLISSALTSTPSPTNL